MTPLKLLDAFAAMFKGKVYNHRNPTQGDNVTLELYEDLLSLQRSTLLGKRIAAATHVVNTTQRVHGLAKSRRGDGTFGELVPTESPTTVSGYHVPRGPTATLEIGAESKIICVAQNRQVGRVISDLASQVEAFNRVNPRSLKVAFVGVNRAPQYTAIEGASKPRSEWRRTRTTGKGKTLHPAQEAASTIATLKAEVEKRFDEFVILDFVATNEDPFEFSWVNEADCRATYSSALTRIARKYGHHFPET